MLHSVRWRHHTSKKGRCFFLSRSVRGLLRVTLPVISWEGIRRKISGLLTPHLSGRILVSQFWLETGDFEEKPVKKEVFWTGSKTGKHGYFCQVEPTRSPWARISQGSIIFFLHLEWHVSVCAFRVYWRTLDIVLKGIGTTNGFPLVIFCMRILQKKRLSVPFQ